MLPVDTLYMLPRDESLKRAADALAEISRDAHYRFKRAAIIAAAAALDPDSYGTEADRAAWSLPEATNACEAVFAAATAEVNRFRIAAACGESRAIQHLDRAREIARFAERAAWFGDLVHEVRAAIVRAWGGEELPEPLPEPEVPALRT